MLLGINFYEQALALQGKYKKPGQDIRNSLQTNATLVTGEWVEFFKKNNFGVGVSVDGPSHIHDQVRVHPDGSGSYARVLSGINLLKAGGISFGGIAVVNSITIRDPEVMFAFIKEVDIPMALNRCNAKDGDSKEVKELAIDPGKYSKFLLNMFDLWINENNPGIKIRPLDELVRAVLGYHPKSCGFLGQCERYFTVDFNGDVYPCDEFLNERYLLGNLGGQKVDILWQSEDFRNYYLGRGGVVEYCGDCEWIDVCHGGCMRDWGETKGTFNPGGTIYCETKKELFQTLRTKLSSLGYIRDLMKQ